LSTEFASARNAWRALGFCLAVLSFPASVTAQHATIDDAWWTYQQDCNGDGCQAGTLSGDFARLNWNPDVTNCNGTLTVFEVVYLKPCASTTWTPFYTNSAHSITGCRSSDGQTIDVPMGTGCACRDYKIEIYRSGQTVPDYVRSGTNDPDLFHHQEQALVEDVCPNDAFGSCSTISGSYGSRGGHNITATKEPGEPNHAGDPGGASIWYCWTAPTNTPVTFDTIGSTFDTLLAVYTGSSVSALSVVASNDDIVSGQDVQSSLTFTPVKGTTYHIAIDGWGGATGVSVLNWLQSGAAAPDLIIWGPAASPTITTRTFSSNDCEVVEGCETAGTHRLLSFTTETRNIGAGDLVIGDPSTNSLFEFATCHGHYHFEQFADYELLDSGGNVVASGHKVGFCLEDVRAWSPTAPGSAKYKCFNQGIQAGWADVYSAGLPCQYIDITSVPVGNYTLQMTVNPANLLRESDTNNNVTLVPVSIPAADCTNTPTNDDFTNAMALTAPSSYSMLNECATKQLGEPNHAGDAGGHSVWFSWTPSSNQTAVISTRRSDFDTLLAVYTGNTISGLTLVASNDDMSPAVKQSLVSFPAAAGTKYRIAVDGWGGAVGTVVINVMPPANDDFSNAFLIAGLSGTTNGYNIGASKEPNEPAHASDVGGRSIWFQWLAPESGPAEFNTAGSSFDTLLAIYTGESVSSLTSVVANDNDTSAGLQTSRVTLPAVAGTTYQIAVDGYGADSGTVSLYWNMASRVGISPLSNGNVQVTFSGVNGQRYGLLASSNLVDWSTQATRTMSSAPQQYIDGPSNALRYYRTTLTQ
jgi:hypothetical protein